VGEDGRTLGKLLAAREILSRAVPRPDFAYVTRAEWLAIGGDPAVFDQLPTVDFGDEVTGA
jgi:hypothetical protein